MLRPPSPELQSKIEELWADIANRQYFWQKRQAPRIIEQIAEFGQPIALLEFINLMHHGECSVREAAEEAICLLLPQVAVDDVVQLEMWIRESWSRFWWQDGSFRATRPTSWMLAAFDPNGRRRERALELLDSSSNLAALPFVLIRLNDWVRQVRERAETWVARRIEEVSNADLLANFPVLSTLRERQKGSTSPMLVSLLNRFKAPECARQLLEALPTMSISVRRSAFRLLLESGGLRSADAQEFLLHGGDPFLGVMLVATLRTTKQYPRADWLLSATQSSSAMLRRTALYAWADAGHPGLLEAALPALFDSSAGIRDFAQFWVRKLASEVKLTALYQEKIESSRSPIRIASAIGGFHEVGGRWEHESYTVWLASEYSSVKVAALKAYANACPDESLAILERCLTGECGSTMGKAAFAILQRRPLAVPVSLLKNVVESSNHRPSRIRALALLMKFDKWVQLPCLLGLVRDHDKLFVLHAQQALSSWLSRFNRSWARPSGALVREAINALEGAKPFLEEAVVLNLTALLEGVETSG